MPRAMNSARHPRRALRTAAALLALSSILLVGSRSAAAPSKADVDAARARWERAQQRVAEIAEQLNVQQMKLDAVNAKIAQLQADRDAAIREQTTAERQLGERAAAAFQGIGAQWAGLLSADSISDFSDRLEFLGNIAQADLDLATRAKRAQEKADWSLAQLTEARKTRADAVQEVEKSLAEAKRISAEAQDAYEGLDRDYRDSLDPREEEILPGGPPPGPNANAQTAIDAAFSVRGTPYVFGAASPSSGFDCSGLVMWAWAHAGVSLPHSSAMMYEVLPHISRDELQPGDLVFFYSPISHVGMYLTPTTMIDANHPGDVVAVRPINWEYFAGAARP